MTKNWRADLGGLGRAANRLIWAQKWWPVEKSPRVPSRGCAFCTHFRLNGMNPGAHIYKGELHASGD